MGFNSAFKGLNSYSLPDLQIWRHMIIICWGQEKEEFILTINNFGKNWKENLKRNC